MQLVNNWIKYALFTSLIGLQVPVAIAGVTPISQFARCVASQKCGDENSDGQNSLACCKACLNKVSFQQHSALQEVLANHLDLVCTQFHGNAKPLSATTKPYVKLFLIGTYEHSSGKKGCNQDRIMWTAPINLYQHDGKVEGSTVAQNGLIRVYPLARCEDGQIGDVLSNNQLEVKVSGQKNQQDEELHFAFHIAPKIGGTVQSKTQFFVDLISELAGLSFNQQNQTLNQWTLSQNAISKNLIQTFSTNDEANERGWKGHTQVFIESS